MTATAHQEPLLLQHKGHPEDEIQIESLFGSIQKYHQQFELFVQDYENHQGNDNCAYEEEIQMDIPDLCSDVTMDFVFVPIPKVSSTISISSTNSTASTIASLSELSQFASTTSMGKRSSTLSIISSEKTNNCSSESSQTVTNNYFKCPHCPAVYRQKKSLNRHLKWNHFPTESVQETFIKSLGLIKVCKSNVIGKRQSSRLVSRTGRL